MPEIAHHDLADQWNVVATFEVDDVPTDPTAVSGVLRKPSGALVTIPDGDPRIDHTAVGVYTFVDGTDEVGVHYLEVRGTAPASSTERFAFIVDPRWPADMLAPHALTSIEECELILDRVGSQGSEGQEEDEKRWIANLINVFSRLAQDYAEREWLPVTDDAEPDVARTFTYDGDGILPLAPYELREVSGVALYSNLPAELRPFWADLTEGYVDTGWSWYGEPRNRSESGTWLELQIPSTQRWCEVTVTGKWGAGTVPVDVRHVVEAEVANSYWASRVRQPVAAGAENFLPQQARQLGESGFALDPRSMRILDGYRNHGLG